MVSQAAPMLMCCTMLRALRAEGTRPLLAWIRTTATHFGVQHNVRRSVHAKAKARSTHKINITDIGNEDLTVRNWRDTKQAKLLKTHGEYLHRQHARGDLVLPLSAAGRRLQDALASGQKDPFSTIKAHLAEENVDLETIRLTLKAAHDELFTLSRSKRAAAYSAKEYPFAKEIMLRIMKNPQLWVPFIAADHRAVLCLCYFAVLEGIDNYIVDWIKIDLAGQEEATELLEKYTDGRISIWRNNLSRNLMQAYLLLETHSNADIAIRSFFSLSTWRNNEIRPRSAFRRGYAPNAGMDGNTDNAFSIWPSLLYLCNALRSPRYYNTDPALFETLVELRSAFISPFDGPWDVRGRVSTAYHVGALYLYHPSSPSPTPFIEVLRHISSETHRGNKLHDLPPTMPTIVKSDMQRAQVVAKANGLLEDAAWIEQTYQNSFGKLLKIEDASLKEMPARWVAPTLKPDSARRNTI